MSDVVEQARTARTNLAEALSLLQAPDAGSLIDSVAEPVAKAMGALHQLENSGGVSVSQRAGTARDAVREALAILQAVPPSPTSDRVTEIIAGSLGLLHGLAQKHETEPGTPAAVAKQPAFDRTQLSSEAAAPQPVAVAQPAAVPQPTVVQPSPARPGGVLDATLPTPKQAPQFEAPPDFAATKPSIPSPPGDDLPPPPVFDAPTENPKRNSKHAPAPQGADFSNALRAEANLGAHSPTNFYKGLSGNDIVDDGGLFVSTYEIPPIGAKLQISVNMPGGYDFEALAVVKWTRESGVGDAPPGFGCSFTSISQEARQLIYRYVRNREPLFHDDF